MKEEEIKHLIITKLKQEDRHSPPSRNFEVLNDATVYNALSDHIMNQTKKRALELKCFSSQLLPDSEGFEHFRVTPRSGNTGQQTMR